jgi:NAD(P)-dependent dehydrogenase (short-subunit alcohol dehydrogenase family)
MLKLTGGRCDALFNNGAFGQPGAVEDLSRDVLRFQFETNLFGTHELTNLLIPVMREQGQGRIIYNSSVLGLVAMRYRGAYNASKFALEGLADTLRLELYGTGIHISLIEPGPILTNFRQNSFALYKKNIDVEHSVHKETYQVMAERLQKEGEAVMFTLPAKAVTEKVIHALESKRPKIRYYVTFPTYLFAILKRILPMSWLDSLLRKI